MKYAKKAQVMEGSSEMNLPYMVVTMVYGDLLFLCPSQAAQEEAYLFFLVGLS